LALISTDGEGLLAAAEAYSSRAPYQWKVPGDKLAAIAEAVRAASSLSNIELVGVTYLKGKADIHRAYLRGPATITVAMLTSALGQPALSAVHELVVLGGAQNVSAVSTQPDPVAPPQPAATAANAAAADPAAAAAPTRLDLATLYTTRGLFTGTPRMPVPSTLNGHLYVPAGAAGSRDGESRRAPGRRDDRIALPLATPINTATVRDVRTQAVIAGDTALAKEVEKKLMTSDSVAAQSETPLSPGEGELRVVDDAFGRRAAVWTRGDDSGSAAALDLLSAHFPNLWEQGKQYLSVEEVRYDLHRFFSRRSSSGQAAAGLYLLNRWMSNIPPAGIKDVKAELYVEVADPKLKDHLQALLQDNCTSLPK